MATKITNNLQIKNLFPTTSMQGESIPGICHAIALDVKKEVRG